MACDREKIIERIKKLLKLAEDEGATQAEATAAALAAQRLITQYDVEEWEVHTEDADPIDGIESKLCPRKWRLYLADAIAPAFRCKYHQVTIQVAGSRNKIKMVFYGYKTDATAAALTFNTLYKLGNKMARKFTKGLPEGSYNAYVLGFVEGIRIELDKQCEALMIVTPKKVEEQYSEDNPEMAEADASISTGNGIDAYMAWYAGKKEGIDAIRARRMDIEAVM